MIRDDSDGIPGIEVVFILFYGPYEGGPFQICD
jgi:hypothetical protein